MMFRFLKMLIVGILVSMFLFPFEFSFLPGINTKMAMAGFGLAVALYYLIRRRQFEIPRSLLGVLLCCSFVSVIGFFSTTYNNTHDYAYTTYIVSASVWLSAAFVVYSAILVLHGRVDYKIVIAYLTGVCVFQCIIAIVIDNVPIVQDFVDRWVLQGQYFLKQIHRLYGIGASLDVAGMRFAAVMALISLLLYYDSTSMSVSEVFGFIFSYAVIFAIGSIIARTTVVGFVGLGIALLVHYGKGLRDRDIEVKRSPVIRSILLTAAIAIPICVTLYNTNKVAYKYMRFGFEGFFSLVEKGHWETTSNDTLEGMVVYPDNPKTWIIGDGYFDSARGDINYLGDTSRDSGYYMGTDIGYLRFIFYFGVIGLLAMSLVMLYTAYASAQVDKEHPLYFWVVALVGFIVWFKVSSDVFSILCLLLCVANSEKRELTEVE